MSVATCGRNILTGLSYDEPLYLQTIKKYKDHRLRFNFSKMLAALTLEMTERIVRKEGCDVMGEFYEERLAKKGFSQFFTPYPICKFMAQSATGEAEKNFPGRPLRILDPACGSGRMLMIAAEVSAKKHYYFGVDIDPTCVKMSALNLFLSGIFSSEIMCANTLLPGKWNGSYITSLLPLGLFRIKDKEKSVLYKMMNTRIAEPKEEKKYNWGEGKPLGNQLEFF